MWTLQLVTMMPIFAIAFEPIHDSNGNNTINLFCHCRRSVNEL